ncbi:DUF397 domain-containing protein [Streptomyces sp. G45]|uniref:DUF397 domain-containing protein n=1 Tax=Streptomyces sp. G45 TaxID=3406627 RepID=UPI003C15BEA6
MATALPSARELGAEGWRKPWSDDVGGACVEAKRLPDGSVALRQSTDPHGPALVFPHGEIARFLAGVKAGKPTSSASGPPRGARQRPGGDRNRRPVAS